MHRPSCNTTKKKRKKENKNLSFQFVGYCVLFTVSTGHLVVDWVSVDFDIDHCNGVVVVRL